ncbi:MAG: hypothetical protein JST34_02055 [Bacteroidetes bacterium]|nr:hypothetical protein [Bacteroidota bacterium]
MRRLLMHTNKWLLPALLLFSGMAFSQPAAINFHKLGFAEGLHDGIIKCIAQDRFGYTWIGTVGAINRFDGKKITQFTYIPGDTSTPYSSQPRCMHADMAGRFWIGFQTGITEYNFTTNKFIRVPSFKNMIISSMESINDSILLVGTRGSYFRYNTKSGKAFNYATSQKQIHAAIKQKTVNSIFKKNNLLYLATTRGLLIHDVVKDEIKEVELPELKNLHILSVCNDREGITWICASGAVRLAKISPDLKKLTKLDNYFTSGLNVKIPAVVSLLLDKKERLWLITADDGLMQFHPSTNTFTRYLHNVHYASGPSSNSYNVFMAISRASSGLVATGKA